VTSAADHPAKEKVLTMAGWRDGSIIVWISGKEDKFQKSQFGEAGVYLQQKKVICVRCL
jgi:hypothetical protein